MATLEQFKQLATTPEEISELASEYVLDQEMTTAKIIQMAADKGFDLTSDEIIQHLTQMKENDEFDDIQLSNEALAAIAGGMGIYGGGVFIEKDVNIMEGETY